MIVSGEVSGPQKHPTDHAAAVFEVHGNQLLSLLIIKEYHKLHFLSRKVPNRVADISKFRNRPSVGWLGAYFPFLDAAERF